MSEAIQTKCCSKCKQIKSLSEFYIDRRAKNGYRPECKSCNSKYHQQEKVKKHRKNWANKYRKTKKGEARQKRYNQSEKGNIRKKRFNKSEKGKAAQKRYWQSEKGKDSKKRYKQIEQSKARVAVNNAVRYGKLPRPDTLKCSCGEQSIQYHHHKGYDKEHKLDVVPVCKLCHKTIHNF